MPGTSTYPTTKDSFATTHSDSESMASVHAQAHNDLADAVNKIENELGVLPKGAFLDVRRRLDAPAILPVSRDGTLTVAAGTKRFYFPFAATITGVSIGVGTAPTGAAVTVDINKNGTTIFTTQANRPSIAATQFNSAVQVPNVTSFAAGDYMSIDVDNIGSTVAGADLVAIIQYIRTS